MFDSIFIDALDSLLSAGIAVLAMIGWRKRQEHKGKLVFKTKIEADAREWQKELQKIYPFIHARYDVILGIQTVDPALNDSVAALKDILSHRSELIARSKPKNKHQAGLIIDEFEDTTRRLFQHQYDVDELEIWMRDKTAIDPLTSPVVSELLSLLEKL